MSDIDEADNEALDEEKVLEDRNDSPLLSRPHGETPPPPEPLPDEKPWDMRRSLRTPMGEATILFLNPLLPLWLKYLANDDPFYFSRVLKGEHTTTAPSQVQDTEVAEGEVVANTAGGGDGVVPLSVAFDPNTLFTLTEVLQPIPASGNHPKFVPQSGQLYFTVNPYVPPVESIGEVGKAAAGDATDDAKKNDDDDGDAAPSASSAVDAARTADGAVEILPRNFKIDAFTIACVFNQDALGSFFGVETLTVAFLEEWVSQVPSEDATSLPTELLSNLLSAVKKVAAANYKIKLDYNIFFQHATKFPNEMDVDRSFAANLISSCRIVPSKPITTALILSCPMAEFFADFLLQLPRSILVQWTLPKSNDDEPLDDEVTRNFVLSHFLGHLCLDVRRRIARRSKGKKDLRKDPCVFHTLLFPKQFERLAAPFHDAVLTTNYSPRDYVPKGLTLYHSDVALLILGRVAGLEASFAALLNKKLSVKQPRGAADVTGTLALLFFALPSLVLGNAQCLIEVASRYISPPLFTRHGLVDIIQFAQVPLGHLPAVILHNFACKFWRPILNIPDVMNLLEEHNPELLEQMKGQQRLRCALFDTLASTTADQLNSILLDRSQVYCPEVLWAAATSKNYDVVAALVRHGVVLTQAALGASLVSILETALVKLRDLELVRLLVSIGVGLQEQFRCGATCGLQYLEDNFTAPEEQKLKLEVVTLWRCVEEQRATDPERKFGVLLAVCAPS